MMILFSLPADSVDSATTIDVSCYFRYNGIFLLQLRVNSWDAMYVRDAAFELRVSDSFYKFQNFTAA